MANDKYYFTNYTGRNIENLLDWLSTYKDSIVLKDGSVHFNGIIYNDVRDMSLVGTQGIVGIRASNADQENLGQFNIFNEDAGKAVQMFAKGSNGYYGIKVNENGMYYIHPNNGSQTTTNFNDIFVTTNTNQTITGQKDFTNADGIKANIIRPSRSSSTVSLYSGTGRVVSADLAGLIIHSHTYPSTDATNDLGKPSTSLLSPRKAFRNLYLTGNLDDGNGNSITIADIVKKIDQYEEITWSALKDLRDNSQLVSGKFYRITDYECMTATENTSSAGHQFDIIVRADSINKLNEVASAIQHAGDTYFSSCKLEAWKLWYCLDNDTKRFGWAKVPVEAHLVYTDGYGDPLYYRESQYDGVKGNYCWSNPSGWYIFTDTLDAPTTGSYWGRTSWGTWNKESDSVNVQYIPATSTEGKGVIYRMIDEFNNDVPYDFKNMLFTLSGKYTNAYTFTYQQNSVIKDASISGFSTGCYDNIIKEYISSNQQQLNFNVFYTTSMYCYGNTFNINCHHNTFGNSCSENIFDNNCYGNTFSAACYDNVLGASCHNNTFGISCSGNTLAIGCYGNVFGNDCHRNILGKRCTNNTFGKFCQFNTFGDYCFVNIFGDSTSASDYYHYNTFDNNCQYICLTSAGAASSSNRIQNIHIHSGVVGSSSTNMRTITVDRGLEYSTDIYANGSKEMILDD